MHVSVNILNVILVGLMAWVFLFSSIHIGMFLAAKNWPIISPFANVMTSVFKQV